MIEEKRNRLNLEIRLLLSIVDMIDGIENEYPDYEDNSMTEEEFLNQQIMLVVEAKTRLLNVFKK